jgi:hypothetical protein
MPLKQFLVKRAWRLGALTLAFLPIAFVGFVGSIMGDCGSMTPENVCAAGKDEALRNTMGVIGLFYLGFAVLILRPRKRERS